MPDEPVVMFGQFVHDMDTIKRVAERTGRRFGELSGRRNDVLNDDAEMHGHVELAAVQLQAGGVGVDLTRARFGGYVSHGTSLIGYQQSRYRLRRPGQQLEVPIALDHFVAVGTVDEDVYEGLARKQEGIDYVIARLRERVSA